MEPERERGGDKQAGRHGERERERERERHPQTILLTHEMLVLLMFARQHWHGIKWQSYHRRRSLNSNIK